MITQNKIKDSLQHQLDNAQLKVSELEQSISELKKCINVDLGNDDTYKSLVDDALSNATIGVCVVDADQKVIWANRAFALYFDLNLNELIGKDKETLLNSRIKNIFENPDEIVRKMTESYLSNSYFECFQCHIPSTENREERWLEHQSRPILNGQLAGGRIEQYYDITDIKKRDLKLQAESQKNNDLNHKLNTDIKLSQEQFDVVDQSNRSKNSYLAKLSHEIRIPIQSIMGFSDLLQDAPLDGEYKEYIEIIHKNGDVLLGILNNVLDLAKFESGNIVLKNEQIDLENILKSIIDNFKPTTTRKNLNINYSIESNLTESLFGDSARLWEILVNLVSNAVNFTEKGFVTIEVKRDKNQTLLQNHDTDDSVNLLFSVSDTGNGIPIDEQQNIFKPFFKNQSNKRMEESGSGLGLSIAKTLVKLMNGKIWLNSTIGEGSTFLFTIELKTKSPISDTENNTSQIRAEDLPKPININKLKSND